MSKVTNHMKYEENGASIAYLEKVIHSRHARFFYK